MPEHADMSTHDLAQRLGLVVSAPNAFHRLQRRVASSRPGAAVFARTLQPIDTAVAAVSGGTATFAGLMANVPVVFLTTSGARTGRPRTNPLIGIPFHGGVGVLGTNYARPRTPGWVVNLEANPEATLSHRGITLPVRAEPVEGRLLEDLIRAGEAVYRGFAAYVPRITGRTLRGFVLRARDTT